MISNALHYCVALLQHLCSRMPTFRYGGLEEGAACVSHVGESERLTDAMLGTITFRAGVHAVTKGRVADSSTGAIYVEFDNCLHLWELIPRFSSGDPDVPALGRHNGQSAQDSLIELKRDIRDERVNKAVNVHSALAGVKDANRLPVPKHLNTQAKKTAERQRNYPEWYVDGDPKNGQKQIHMCAEPIAPCDEAKAVETMDILEIISGPDSRGKIYRRRRRRNSKSDDMSTFDPADGQFHGRPGAGLYGAPDHRNMNGSDQLSDEMMVAFRRTVAELVVKGAMTQQGADEILHGAELSSKYDQGVKAQLHFSMHMLSEAGGPFADSVLGFISAFLKKRRLDWYVNIAQCCIARIVVPWGSALIVVRCCKHCELCCK